VRRHLTGDWSIELEGDYVFDRRRDAVEVRGQGRLIRASEWQTRCMDELDILGEFETRAAAGPSGSVREPGSAPGEFRFAYWRPEPETSDFRLEACTVRGGGYLQLEVWVPQADLGWARAVWRSVRFIA